MFGVLVISCNENGEELYGFDESVLILGNDMINENSKYGEEVPIKLELVNFNHDFVLEENYNIGGYQFSDDGKYNDEIAGDGIYTSLETFSLEEGKSEALNAFQKNSIGGNFKFHKELEQYLQQRNLDGSMDKGGIGISCKVRLVSCSGYYYCFPFKTCTCLEFYDCEVYVGVEFD